MKRPAVRKASAEKLNDKSTLTACARKFHASLRRCHFGFKVPTKGLSWRTGARPEKQMWPDPIWGLCIIYFAENCPSAAFLKPSAHFRAHRKSITGFLSMFSVTGPSASLPPPFRVSSASPCKTAIAHASRLFGRETRQCNTKPCATRGRVESRSESYTLHLERLALQRG